VDYVLYLFYTDGVSQSAGAEVGLVATAPDAKQARSSAMSRLWDTSEIYVRTEVDELLRDYPNRNVDTLADSFEQWHPTYEGDLEFAREIIVELRKRAAGKVRFWPEPPGLDLIEREVRAIIAGTANALKIAEPEELEPAGGPSYWWQRM
jgi:hypothetical protein